MPLPTIPRNKAFKNIVGKEENAFSSSPVFIACFLPLEIEILLFKQKLVYLPPPPPAKRMFSGVYWNQLVCPFVRVSVCPCLRVFVYPSVCPSVYKILVSVKALVGY